MILGIGIDILKISRFIKLFNKHEQALKLRIFTKYEQDVYFQNRDREISFLSKRFAAKEAFSKALGEGIGKIAFSDIGVERTSEGKPLLVLSHRAQCYVDKKFGYKCKFHVSLSDEKDNAIAMVIIEA